MRADGEHLDQQLGVREELQQLRRALVQPRGAREVRRVARMLRGRKALRQRRRRQNAGRGRRGKREGRRGCHAGQSGARGILLLLRVGADARLRGGEKIGENRVVVEAEQVQRRVDRLTGALEGETCVAQSAEWPQRNQTPVTPSTYSSASLNRPGRK